MIQSRIYLLVIYLVQGVLQVFRLFSPNNKLKKFIEGRDETFPKLSQLSQINTKRYWFHCASLGEFEQAKPIIEGIKSREPDSKIVLSFFSPSGYEQKKNYNQAEAVFYLPLDTPSNARRLIELIKPYKVIFIKYEIWYFLLSELHNNKIDTYLVSATFRQQQFIFSFWGKWLFAVLKYYNKILVQDKNSLLLLQKHGLNNVIKTGDTRFDRVLNTKNQVQNNPKIDEFKQRAKILILGSSWEKEENELLSYLRNKTDFDFKIIIAPHSISEKRVNEIQQKFKDFTPICYTEFTYNTKSRILILNTIGHLANAYYYADYAFVGGGFTGALHNVLEPLVFGVPVICGSNISKFPEASQARQAGVLFTINENEFSQTFNNLKHVSDNAREELRNKCYKFILQNAGASDSTLQFLN